MGRAFGNVSGNFRVKNSATMPRRDEQINISSYPYSTVSKLPRAGPPAIPVFPATPKNPNASPLLSTGTISVRSALEPAGRNPVLKP